MRMEQKARPTPSAPASAYPAVDAGPGSQTAPEVGFRQALSSLSSPQYRILFLGVLLWMGSMRMMFVAVGFLTYELTSSAVLLGLVQSGFAPTILVLGLFGGVIADRIDRKSILVIGQVVTAAGYLAIALLIWNGAIHWAFLLLITALDGATFSFMGPAMQSIIPSLVGKEKLGNALALNAAALSTLGFATPAIAGTIYGLFGAEAVFFTTACITALSAVVTRTLPSVKVDAPVARSNMLADLKEGLEYIWQRPIIITLLVLGAASSLFAMSFSQLLPVLVVDIYHAGAESYGVLLSAMAIGSLIGAVTIAVIGRWKRGLLLLIGTLLSGLCLIVVAAVPLYVVAVGVIVILGLGNSGYRTINQALTMEQADSRYAGRVMSVWTMNFSLIPLGVIPGGVIAEYFGGQAAVGTFAALLLTTGLFIFLTQKKIRALQ